ncbi:MAG: SLBB domain-containing protein [Bacteroides sp.]|nr:SLBB domain-containing protein [Roseburia sp.]MCM1345473.1 SLBB domain-containing protein [Bacteroides sp.]MCM1419983.1 SLBB domain-containing protein [Bacteroides sp.]
MIRRILFLLTLCWSVQMIWAQTMTDEQVIRYVTEQREKGADQNAIVSQLLKKGCTVDQIRRIRKKYQAQQEQLGALDITGEGASKSKSRLRTEQQIKEEKSRQQNNYMVRSAIRGKDGLGGMSYDERKQGMNDEIGFMDIDSLIYYRNMFYDESEVFGHNIFNNQMLTFEPNMNMPTPENYILGAGDNVIIDVWGSSQQTFEDVVSPDGTVTIEGVGPVKLAGKTVKEANTYIKGVLGQFYSSSQVNLTVGETRSVQVQVMGEVVAPGTYTLSALSSAFNAMYAAGGINDIGTLRDIKVYRKGRLISTIDIYDYIFNGNSKGDVRLQDNDVIVVGTYDCLVNIRGKVKRPMFYEMKKNESVASILSYAGGFTGDAYRKNVRLIRKSGSEYSIHTVEEFEMNGFMLDDGDSIFVDSVIPRFSNMVEVRGAVFHPGMFQMNGSINTVRELVNAAEGLREDAFLARAVMHRRKEDLTLEVLPVDIQGLMNGTVADIPLRKDDVLFIPSKLDMQGEQTVKIGGEVNYPGTYMYADNTSLEDIVLQAGGLTDAASMVKVDVYRRIVDAKAKEESASLIETFSFGLKDGFVIDGDPGFILKPFDEVVVRKSPTYTEQQNVSVEGAVNFMGDYAMSNKNFHLSDLVNMAGGLSAVAYSKGARLERRMTEEERLQRENTLRTSQIALYEESMSSEKNFDFNRADTLLNMKLDLGNTYPVAINLDKAMADPGGIDDITLREGDRLVVPQYTNTVKVSGDVMYPISMNYKEGESLNYYIKRAGGYGDRARKSRVYAVYMNGSVELISHHSSKAIQPGCEIVVPSKQNKSKMSTAEVMSIGTSATSVATMIITVANILK